MKSETIPKCAARSTDSLLQAGGCYITGAALCYSCISAADFCSCSVPLIEKALFTDSGQDTTSGSWGRLAGMNTTKQKGYRGKEEDTDRGKKKRRRESQTIARETVNRRATETSLCHLRSSCRVWIPGVLCNRCGYRLICCMYSA